MDDYQRGILSRRSVAVPKRRQGRVEVVFPSVSVAVVAPVVDDIAVAVVRALRGVEAKVNLCCPGDMRAGRDLAWSCGAMFHPGDDVVGAIAQAREKRAGLDVVVFIGAEPVESEAEVIYVGSERRDGMHCVDISTLTGDAVAAAVVYLCHPLQRFLAPVTISGAVAPGLKNT